MQETNLKRRNRVFKSLHKPLTYLGVERTVFYFVCVGAVGVFWSRRSAVGMGTLGLGQQTRGLEGEAGVQRPRLVPRRASRQSGPGTDLVGSGAEAGI